MRKVVLIIGLVCAIYSYVILIKQPYRQGADEESDGILYAV